MKRLTTCLCACATLAAAVPARADVSSWAFVGGGAARLEQQGLAIHSDRTLTLETGIGSPARHLLVVGGLFKLTALFGNGADLGISLRVATRSFVTGGFGLALDAGPYQRFWGAGSTGGQAALVFGAPWGITLSAGGGLGTHEAHMYGATLGIDFARLTVHRLTGENWFPNPHPAYRPKD